MLNRILAAVVLTSVLACGTPPPVPEAIQTATPATTSEPVLIYLHGAIIETQGPRPTHPEHGIYEYQLILDRFSELGFRVESEQRAANADVDEWAHRTADRIEQLIAAGTEPSAITVVGFSKGGAIALRASGLLDRPEIGWVIVAACGEWIPETWVPKGRLLSLREASDHPRIQSCQSVFDRTPDPTRHREVVLELGGGHGAFYAPRTEWVAPVVEFAG